jgi:tetratricopeptide (TPR) repeat protein
LRSLAKALSTFALSLPLLAQAGADPSPDPQLALLRAAVEEGKTDLAIEAGEKAVKRAPESAEAWLWLGRAYGDQARKASIFRQMSLAKKCKAAWEKSLSLDPKGVPVRMDLLRFHLLAPGIAGGDKDEARRLAADIGRLEPARGHVAAGMIADFDKAPEKAEAAYRKAFELDAAAGFRPLASFLLRTERYPEAEAVCRKLLETSPDEAVAHFLLGRVAQLSGTQLEKGLASFDRFLELAREGRPSRADGLWRKGQLLEKLGRKPEAVAALREALRSEPEHKGAREDIKRLGG